MTSTVLSSLRGSMDIIYKKKFHFLILFITQFLFLFVLSFLFVNYTIQIGESAQEVIGPLQDIQPSLGEFEAATAVLSNAENIATAYSAMKNSILLFALFSFLAYVVLNGVNWDIANLIVNEKSDFLRYQWMFGKAALVFTALGIVLGGFSLSLLIENKTLLSVAGILVFVIATYFAYISFALINKYIDGSVYHLVKHAFQLGFHEFGHLIFNYFFMMLVIGLFAWLVTVLLNAPFFVLLLSLVVLIAAMNWGKIFFILSVKRLVEK